MESSKRIILNTCATYGRSLFALLVGLFTARWVLLSLGEVDFGLFGVVGGLIALCAVFNALLTSATTRFFAVAIGEARNQDRESGEENCRRWFNVAVLAHGVLAVVLVSVGYPIGVWAIEHWLTIPSERIADCIWVFRFSCLTAFVNMVNVPFNGMFVAKQEIAEQSLYSSFQTVFMFLIAGYMILHPGDWLFGYAALMSANSMIPELVICLRACMKYRECRLDFRQMRDLARLRKMALFALCQAFTGIGFICCNQGMNILVNKVFGPVLNASMGVATKVQTHASALTAALGNAFQPAIAAAWGAGDAAKMRRLSLQVTKFGLFGALVFVMPLLVGIDGVLKLWLKDPPPHSSLLCACLLMAFVIEKFGYGHEMALNAVGRIALYQLCLGLSMILVPCLAVAGIWLGYGIASVGGALVLGCCVGVIVRICFGWRIAGMRLMTYLVNIPIKVAVVAAASFGLGRMASAMCRGAMVSLFLSMFVGAAVVLGGFLVLVLDAEDRGKAMGLIKRKMGKS